ncbi:hypothetical protein ABFX02_10G143200 [Erythranthe guttata]
MATSSARNLIWSVLAAAILVFTLFAAADKPPEVAKNQLPPAELATRRAVKFYLWCMTMMNSNQTRYCGPWEISCTRPSLIGCRYHYEEVQNRYEKTGRLSEDYVQALRMYNNYNQTDVDIDICNLAYSRCPNETKALNTRCTTVGLKSGSFFCSNM